MSGFGDFKNSLTNRGGSSAGVARHENSRTRSADYIVKQYCEKHNIDTVEASVGSPVLWNSMIDKVSVDKVYGVFLA